MAIEPSCGDPTNPPKSPQKSPAWIPCPICEKRFDQLESSAMPFCSPRCRQIDLGRWLNESYGLPYEGENCPEPDEDPYQDQE